MRLTATISAPDVITHEFDSRVVSTARKREINYRWKRKPPQRDTSHILPRNKQLLQNFLYAVPSFAFSLTFPWKLLAGSILRWSSSLSSRLFCSQKMLPARNARTATNP